MSDSGGADNNEPQLLQQVELALQTGEPLDLLGMVSAMLAGFDPRLDNEFEPSRGPEVTLAQLVETFLDVDEPATSALLAVIAEFIPDEVQATKIRRGLRSSRHPLPLWLTRLGEARVERVVDMTTELGDGDNEILGLTLITGEELSAVIYIDHNMGTLVKDAFLVPASMSDLLHQMKNLTEFDHDTPERASFADLDLAEARKRIADAIDRSAQHVPMIETESWPAVRPIIEWMIAKLPAGGTGYNQRELPPEEIDRIIGEFLASPYGKDHQEDDHVAMLDDLIAFVSAWGTCDPYRWSPFLVKDLLTDWLPRRVIANRAYLHLAPQVMRSFIAYSHHKTGIRRPLTEDTLAAVDHFDPLFQEALRSDPRETPDTLRAALDAQDPDAVLDSLLSSLPGNVEFFEQNVEFLEHAVGGEAQLAALDDRPLPDEPFDWSGIPDDIHDRVATCLALTDECSDDLLDQECRTALRRLLASAAAGDPQVFRSRVQAKTSAAALAWTILKSNDLLYPSTDLTVQELLEWFDVSGSVTKRATALVKAAGIEVPEFAAGFPLGRADLLVSVERRSLIELKELLS